MCTLKRLLTALVIGIVGTFTFSAHVLAQPWPQRTGRMIVPLPPGTAVDVSARLFAEEPMIWLDVLDLPIVNFFETMFAEYLGDVVQPVSRRDGDSMAFYGSGVLPDHPPGTLERSLVLNYTYARVRPILGRLRDAGEIDKRHGVRVRYANPVTGGWVMPTMGAQLALLPAGFTGESYRATDGTIFVCVEGEGSTNIGDKELAWSPGDVFVAPPWQRYEHIAAKESVLFSICDRPAQEALGIWREIN